MKFTGIGVTNVNITRCIGHAQWLAEAKVPKSILFDVVERKGKLVAGY